MAKSDEFPRGQISTIILMCLQDKDKYGYEIIDEVLNKTNGKISIKQPSLYSSLKRMEEQSLISSYWRDSEIGGRRHYYHLTDLGKKHLEKWQENISYTDLASNSLETNNSISQNNSNQNTEESKTIILQQENLFRQIESKPKETVEKNNQIDEASYVADGQFDLFNINKQENEYYGLPSSINAPEQIVQYTTNLTKHEPSQTVSFDFIKKNKSFSDTVKSITNIEDRKIIEKTTEDIVNHNSLSFNTSAINILNSTASDSLLSTTQDILNNHDINGDEINNFNENLNNNIDEKQNNNIDEKQNNNIDEKQNEYTHKISLLNLDGYIGNKNIENAANEPQPLNFTQDDNNYEPLSNTAIKTSPNNIKEDGAVIITEKLNAKDIPKQPRFEPRLPELYISGNSIAPKLKTHASEDYTDRINELYEKSKHNAENQKLEIIDSKIKFSSYNDLQEFYNEQNIKFKPYQKTLYKSNKDFDMIRISKLKMLTSLYMFCVFSILSGILGAILSKVSTAMYNHPLTYTIIPAISLIIFFINILGYEKSPQKRVAYDINKFKFNWLLFSLSTLILPAIFAVNLFLGFSFASFKTYAVTLIYPSILSLSYVIYYIIQKILSKQKSLY